MPCPGRLDLGLRDGDGWGGELAFIVRLLCAPGNCTKCWEQDAGLLPSLTQAGWARPMLKESL